MTAAVIIDTSVLVTHCLSKGATYAQDIFRLAAEGKIQLCTTEEMLDEVHRSLSKPSVRHIVQLRQSAIHVFLAWYKQICTVITIRPDYVVEKVYRDPDDNKFLILADSVSAQAIVTVDKDLLILEAYKQTKILRPSEYLELFQR